MSSMQFQAASANGPNPHLANPADMKKTSIMTSDGTILGTREVQTADIGPFKHRYMLLDDSGNPIEEPNENDLASIRRMRQCVKCMLNGCDCFIFLLILGYLAFRFYAWSCYRQFNWLTIAQQSGRSFPISDDDLHDLVKTCHDATDGTGVAPGTTPCRPTANQTLWVCESILENNRPSAFVGLFKEWFDWKIKGIDCFHGICSVRDKLAAYDWEAFLLAIFLILLARCCKCWADQSVKAYRKRCQKLNADRISETKDMSMGYQTGVGSPTRVPMRTAQTGGLGIPRSPQGYSQHH